MPYSIFGYNVTRKYPYRWFTWVVVIGGIISTSLLTAINVAANGYELSIQTTTNPNDTEHSSTQWFQKKPWSQAARVSPSCQDQTLVVGSQFYTNNFGLSYTILSFRSSESRPQASCSYHGDYLHDCRLDHISLSTSYNNISVHMEVDISASVNCTIYDNDSRPITMTLGVAAEINAGQLLSYVASSKDQATLPLFLSLDKKSQPSIYWSYWMTTILWSVWGDHGEKDLKGYDYTPHDADANTEAWVKPLGAGYFADNVDVLLWQHSDQTPNSPSAQTFASTFGIDILLLPWKIYISPNTTGSTTDPSNPYMTTVSVADSFAKSLQYLILSDLGQSSTDVDAFVSPHKTTEFFNKTLELVQNLYNVNVTEVMSYGLPAAINSAPPESLDELYSWYNTGPSQVDPATISLQYLCQVPRLKPIGSVIVSVVIADLVFLHLLWNILNLVMKHIVERRDPKANYCPGCVAAGIDIPRTDSTTTANDQQSKTDDIAYTSGSLHSKSHNSYQSPGKTILRTQISTVSPATSFRALFRNDLGDADESTVAHVNRSKITRKERSTFSLSD